MCPEDIAYINLVSPKDVTNINFVSPKDVTYINFVSPNEITFINFVSPDDVMYIILFSPKEVTYINFVSPKDVTYINFLCFEMSLLKLIGYAYDTSFLNRRQVVINGDVESNPGPVSSVQSYRAAIGRFNGKFKVREKLPRYDGKQITFHLFIMLLFSILFYTSFVGIMITSHTYFLALVIPYGFSFSILLVCMDWFSIVTQKMLNKSVLMRKSVTEKTLIRCRNVDTHVLDGRNRLPHSDTKICVENGQICCILERGGYCINSEKVWELSLDICSYGL